MNLAGNIELNLGAQRVRGKILSRKELRCDSFFPEPRLWNYHSGLAKKVKRFRWDICVVFPEREIRLWFNQVLNRKPAQMDRD